MGSISELQTVFDTDLLVVLEGMGLLDSNQSERLRTCFQYRNHSATQAMLPSESMSSHSLRTSTQLSCRVERSTHSGVTPNFT